MNNKKKHVKDLSPKSQTAGPLLVVIRCAVKWRLLPLMSFLFPLPFSPTSCQGPAFSGVTGSCRGRQPCKSETCKGVQGRRVREGLCLPSKDCPREVPAGAVARSARRCLHIPGLSALLFVTVGSGRWDSGWSFKALASWHESDVSWNEITVKEGKRGVFFFFYFTAESGHKA